jgi:hypothetical protein
MKQEKDYRFDLIPFLKEQEQTQRLYVYKWQIENNGCYKIQFGTENVKVYTPQLAIVLASQELSVCNIETETQVTIKGLEYLKTYVKAYKEGQHYFESEYKVSPNIIYSSEAEQYVRDIHENFFHVQHNRIIKGWGYVKDNFDNILTHKSVQEFGYYSGIVSKVEELVKKYRLQFEKYEKCEHDSIILEHTETEQGNQSENDIVRSTIEDWLFEFKDMMSESDYENLVSALKQYIENGIFPKLLRPIRINGKPNIKLFGWHLNRIFEANGKGITKELLQFAKHNISLFMNVEFDENNYLKSNLYKYCTTKIK